MKWIRILGLFLILIMLPAASEAASGANQAEAAFEETFVFQADGGGERTETADFQLPQLRGDAVLRIKNNGTAINEVIIAELAQEGAAEPVYRSEVIEGGKEDTQEIKLSPGKYTLRVTFSASCEVTVSGTYRPALSKTSLFLAPGKQAQLEAANTGSVRPVWSSSKPDVATVDENGVVRALHGGKTVVTCHVGGASLTAEVIVPGLNEEKVTLKAGEQKQLEVENSGGRKLTWKSDNKKVATVSKKGLVKAVGAGTAKITVSIGDEASLTCTVTVTPKINKTSALLAKGKKLTLKVTGAGKEKKVWSTSDKKVATVSNSGVVKAVGAGTAVISCKVGSATVKCKVTVWVKEDLYDKVTPVDVEFYSLENDTLYITFENTTGFTITRIDFQIKTYNARGKRTRSYNCWTNKSMSMDDGEKYTGELELKKTTGTESAKITITKFKLSDGTTVTIPSSKRQTFTFSSQSDE